MTTIHSTALVSGNAELAEDVSVGAYSVIEDNVFIGAGTKIGPHTVIRSNVRMGKDNFVDAQVALGGAPQDISYKGEETWLEIGDNNTIRETCSIHRSTNPEQPTTLGNDCFIMCNTHIGHDCQLGNGVIVTSYSGISGHVYIGDKAVVGGSVGVHQFVRIGTLAMVAGFTPLRKDVLPFTMVGGQPVRHYRLNTIGLRRAGVKGDRYRKLENYFRALRSGDQDSTQSSDNTEEISILEKWLGEASKRGVYGFLSAD